MESIIESENTVLKQEISLRETISERNPLVNSNGHTNVVPGLFCCIKDSFGVTPIWTMKTSNKIILYRPLVFKMQLTYNLLYWEEKNGEQSIRREQRRKSKKIMETIKGLDIKYIECLEFEGSGWFDPFAIDRFIFNSLIKLIPIIFSCLKLDGLYLPKNKFKLILNNIIKLDCFEIIDSEVWTEELEILPTRNPSIRKIKILGCYLRKGCTVEPCLDLKGLFTCVSKSSLRDSVELILIKSFL
ncbi:unnamed protein product [Moneuplotes crassus]|uniref:Uncharacterized protein n=1 Tax=Euplotes crassus TaxID=5936 RepID=A0AAD1UFD9_EUPCR|nr:unnamed protein product [Moneuplotes crassus]